MGRTKKPGQQPSNDNAEVDSESTGNEPAKDLKKNFKTYASRHSVKDMVTNALKAKASSDGVPLVTIRKYIADNYNNKRKLSKVLQESIKDFIKQEFEKGAIVSNSKEKTIKFNSMRFSSIEQ